MKSDQISAVSQGLTYCALTSCHITFQCSPLGGGVFFLSLLILGMATWFALLSECLWAETWNMHMWFGLYTNCSWGEHSLGCHQSKEDEIHMESTTAWSWDKQTFSLSRHCQLLSFFSLVHCLHNISVSYSQLCCVTNNFKTSRAYNKNHYSYTHISLQMTWGSVVLD